MFTVFVLLSGSKHRTKSHAKVTVYYYYFEIIKNSFVECFRLRPEDCTAVSFNFFTFSDRVYTSKALKNIYIVQKFLKSVDFDNQFRFKTDSNKGAEGLGED